MKNLTKALLLILMLALSLCVCAEDAPTVYVTVANGTPVLARLAVTVTDIDSDGVLTVNDALTLAHEAAFEGGAAAGYASALSDYGMSLNRLWGVDNGGAYGYYVNNAMAYSLLDPVQDGDSVYAYVYTDLAAFSDLYCYFDRETVTAAKDASFTLTLTAMGFDESWMPVALPVAGAVVTVNGESTEFVTDEAGQVTVTVFWDGDAVLSAYCVDAVLIPPVCIVTPEA